MTPENDAQAPEIQFGCGVQGRQGNGHTQLGFPSIPSQAAALRETMMSIGHHDRSIAEDV